MAPHSSSLACKTPWMEEPGRLHPWGWDELDTTEQLHLHFSLSCIGEGNGNPFQCSCLENPKDGGAWWAAIYGVAQSRTQLKQFSSSSSRIISSVQSLSCPTLCDPMNCSTPGIPIHHHLPEFIQTHVHRVGDAIQPSRPLSSPSPPAPNPSQHQSIFQ